MATTRGKREAAEVEEALAGRLDPGRRRIHRRLSALIGEGAAALYLDGCRLLEGGSGLHSASHLVAHLFREVESAMRRVIVPLRGRDSGAGAQGSEGSEAKRHKDQIGLVLSYLGIDEGAPTAKAWLSLTGDGSLSGLAHRRNLRTPRPLEDREFQERVALFETVLEDVLDRLERSYLDIYKLIDDLKAVESPTAGDAGRLSGSIPFNQVALGYFFKDLEKPEWLPLLEAEGFFEDPRPAVRDEESGTISFPPWPQSGYLARIAARDPDGVMKVALRIETDNVSIQSDLIDAGLRMPVAHAAAIVQKAVSWLASPYMLLPMKAGELAEYLAKGGELDAGIALAHELLRIVPGVRTKLEGEDAPWPPDPRPRINEWEFKEFVWHRLPAIVKAAPEKALWMIVDALSEGLTLGKYTQSDTYDDISYVWRPAIEPHEQNVLGGGDIRSHLITAAADAACNLARQEAGTLRRVVTGLEAKRWIALRRIALHVLMVEGDKDPELLTERLTDPNYYTEIGLRHELSALLSQRYQELGERDRLRVLEIIEAGPTEGERVGKQDEESRGDGAKELDRDVWTMRWFRAIEEHLPLDRRERLRALEAKRGRLEHPDLLAWSSGVMSGPTSPLSDDAMNALTVESLVEYLGHWRPAEGFTMDSIEGVSRTLAKAVAATPERYVGQLHSMLGLDPSYVRGLIMGMGAAFKQGKDILWGPLMDFLMQIAQKHPSIARRQIERRWEGDPDWCWTHLEIARLLSDALSDEVKSPPYELREAVWKTLGPLLTVHQYDVDAGDSGEGGISDPMTRSLNDVRGQAFHGLIAYGLWVRRREAGGRVGEPTGSSIDNLPEARATLGAYLSQSGLQEATVHAVLGWRIMNLAYLDEEWTKALLPLIFPGEGNPSLQDAAWHAFLRANRPSRKALELLRSQYEASALQTGVSKPKVGWEEDPDEKLMEHMIYYYAWGALGLEDPVFLGVWTRCRPNVRLHGLHYIGTRVQGAGIEVRKRLQALWEWRLSLAEANKDDESMLREVAKFGWWFASGEFDPFWSLEQLRKALSLVDEVEGDFNAMERLSVLSGTYPMECTELVWTMIEKKAEPWQLLVRREQVSAVIRSGVASEAAAARQAANDLANRLSAKGYPEFGELIS